ncbi:MAG TPA: GAF domain-containing sensor histidine kinase [Myxococcaceae bacterium]|nr:GAF domain-containing sensor histidine kinase [Myxococcaceae bacterium]
MWNESVQGEVERLSPAAFLERVNASLARTRTRTSVVEVLLRLSGARWGGDVAVYLLGPRGEMSHVKYAGTRGPSASAKFWRGTERRLRDAFAQDDPQPSRRWTESAPGSKPMTYLMVALRLHERIAGALVLARLDQAFDDADAALAEGMSLRAGWALDHASLHERELRSRRRAERLLERSHAVQQATAAFSQALTMDEVAAVTVRQALDLADAAESAVWVAAPVDRQLRVTAAEGTSGFDFQASTHIRWDDPHPACEAFRQRRAIWRDATAGQGTGEAVFLPLEVEGRTLGVVALAFSRAQTPDAEARDFPQLLAGLCAQALERARLFERSLQANALRDEFLSIAGHEFKTPLTTLKLQLQALRVRSFPPERVARRLEVATHQVDRLNRLIETLLNVSRVSAEPLALNPVPMDWSQTVREVVQRMAPDAVRARASVRIDVPPELKGVWDPERVEQVVVNLLSNALKYGAGTEIDVALSSDGELASLRVKDRGIGIAPDVRERLFQRFGRGVPVENYGGFGLGLWMTRRIVEAHGGTVHVEGEPGQGATFTVTLPVDGPLKA